MSYSNLIGLYLKLLLDIVIWCLEIVISGLSGQKVGHLIVPER
jgi:hypothetical protein